MRALRSLVCLIRCRSVGASRFYSRLRLPARVICFAVACHANSIFAGDEKAGPEKWAEPSEATARLREWDSWAERAAGGAMGETSGPIIEVKRSLAPLDRVRAAAALSKVLDCHPGAPHEMSLHVEAARTLRDVGGDAVIDGLKKALRSGESYVVAVAIDGLRKQPEDVALESVTSVLEAGRVEWTGYILQHLCTCTLGQGSLRSLRGFSLTKARRSTCVRARRRCCNLGSAGRRTSLR